MFSSVPNKITIDAQNSPGVRPFHIADTAAEVTLSELIVTGGHVSTTQDDGGGILNEGPDTSLNNVFVTGNTAWDGGGIYNDGTIHLQDSRVSDNSSGDDGAGIYNRDYLCWILPQ